MGETGSLSNGRERKSLTPYIIMKNLFTIILRITALSWRRALEGPRSLKGYLAKVNLILSFGLTKERCLCAHWFAKKIIGMSRKSGWLFVSIYCKHAAASLQTAYAGEFPIHQPFPISLTRSGYPRIIPAYHRHVIMLGGDRADGLVRMYLSFFSLTKVIPLAKRVSKETFSSIITPLTQDEEESVNNMANVIKQLFPVLVSRYIPWVTTIPLKQGMTWLPTWKAIPNYKVFKGFGLPKSPYIVWPLELKCFGSMLRFIHSKGDQFSPLCLWPSRVRYALDPRNKIYTNLDLDACEKSFAPLLPVVEGPAAQHFCFGRLGSSVEGRAKRRIFAIGNYVCQRLLKPVHEFLMAVLKRLPSDGTFNQTGPLRHIVDKPCYYSYDLSAATDRMPLRVLFYSMEYLFGRSYASAVVNSTLACHRFEVPFVKGKGRSGVSFITGQPLGFLSSWPLFALSHHLIVWAAAELVNPGVRFWDYALLGDDVVIANRDVALSYRRVMEGLKVKISDIKSLVSSHACEFAKRFLVKGLRKDLSPVSLKDLMGAHHPLGIASLRMKFPQIPEKVLMRFQGAGYRTLAKPMSARPKKYIRLANILTKYLLPTDLWLGRGLPLNPYVKAAVVQRLILLLKPKDLKLVPDEFIPDEDDVIINPNTGKPGRHDFNSRGFLEYSLLRGQMRLWLNYQRWYCSLLLKLETGCDLNLWIKEALDPPIVITNWKVTKEEPEMVRFGYQFKLYDFVGVTGLTFMPSVLPEHLSCWLCRSIDRSSCTCAQLVRDLRSMNKNVVRGTDFIVFLD